MGRVPLFLVNCRIGFLFGQKNGTDILKNVSKVGLGVFSSLWQIAWIKVVFVQNYPVCDLTIIILSVKEFHITIFEFYTRD